MSDAMINEQISGTQENQEPERWSMAARVLMILAFGFAIFYFSIRVFPYLILNAEISREFIYAIADVMALFQYAAGFVILTICKSRKRDGLLLIPLGLQVLSTILVLFSEIGYLSIIEIIFILFQIAIVVSQSVIIYNKSKHQIVRNMTILSIIIVSIYTIVSFAERYFTIISRLFALRWPLFYAAFIVIDFVLLQAITGKKKKEIPQAVAAGGIGNMTQTYRLFCPSCGARFVEGKKFCDQCGNALSELAQPEAASMAVNPAVNSAADVPTTGIKVLSFFIPLAGFIMWASWINVTPNKAKAAGKFTLIGVIFYVGLVILTYAIYFWWLTSLFN